MPLHLHAYRARQTLSSVFTNRTLKRPEGRAPASERGVYAASPAAYRRARYFERLSNFAR